MSFSSVRKSRRPNSGARRPRPRALGVEPMESRALLTSAAVTSAIASLQQAETAIQSQIASEIATLKANIVTIQSATSTFRASLASGDKATNSDAIRDEKFAIGQQTFLIRTLQKTGSLYDATLKGAINALNKGKLDPVTVPAIISTGESNLGSEISTVDSTASYELGALTGTFAAGKA